MVSTTRVVKFIRKGEKGDKGDKGDEGQSVRPNLLDYTALTEDLFNSPPKGIVLKGIRTKDVPDGCGGIFVNQTLTDDYEDLFREDILDRLSPNTKYTVSFLLRMIDHSNVSEAKFGLILYTGTESVEFINLTKGATVNGKEKALTSDAFYLTHSGGAYTRYTVTFTTASDLSSLDHAFFLWRRYKGSGGLILAQMKVERGDSATAWCLSENDKIGEKGDKGDPGNPGERGYTGVSIRRGEWQEGVYYRNDSEDGSEDSDGNRYLDEVSVTDLTTNTAAWYLAKAAHNGVLSSTQNKPSGEGNNYWEPISAMTPIRTSYADIANAFIQFLQVNQIVIADDDNKVYGAFGGGSQNQYPLWFGGETAAEAVTKINRNGDFWSGSKFSMIDGLLRTLGDKSRVEIHDGVVEMYGALSFPNIRLGVNDDGCAVLEFYNKSGQKMYDLGPDGLSKITTTKAYFTESNLQAVNVDNASAAYNSVAYIAKKSTKTYYQFFPKQTKTGTTIVYWTGETSSETAPLQTGQYYQSNGLKDDLPTGSLIPDGWYAEGNDGSHPKELVSITDSATSSDDTTYFERLYHFSMGKLDKQGKITWRKSSNGLVSNYQLSLGD